MSTQIKGTGMQVSTTPADRWAPPVRSETS